MPSNLHGSEYLRPLSEHRIDWDYDPKALVVVTWSNRTYTFEYRTKTGYDQGLNYPGGVIVHTLTDTGFVYQTRIEGDLPRDEGNIKITVKRITDSLVLVDYGASTLRTDATDTLYHITMTG